MARLALTTPVLTLAGWEHAGGLRPGQTVAVFARSRPGEAIVTSVREAHGGDLVGLVGASGAKCEAFCGQRLRVWGGKGFARMVKAEDVEIGDRLFLMDPDFCQLVVDPIAATITSGNAEGVDIRLDRKGWMVVGGFLCRA